MATSRRSFLQQIGYGLASAAAFSATVRRFGLIDALAQAPPDYKALVCIFLAGGNDGNNMVIPYDDYNAAGGYSAVRTASGLAISQSSLLQISPLSQAGLKFGFHPNMPEIQTLFNQQRLAVLCNVGTLLQPITKQQYQSNSGVRPYQLFSHSDQVAQQQASISNSPSQTGWGGRISDMLVSANPGAPLPMGISIAGTSLYLTGFNTRQLAIADSNTPLSNVLVLTMSGTGVTARRTAFDQIRALDGQLFLTKASEDTTNSALVASAALSTNPPINTLFPNTSIGRQLLQIARVISLRSSLGMQRQIFFAQLGGFDTHSNQNPSLTLGQNSLLQQLSQAMGAFHNATIELGVADKVTTFTLSDFGRTFQPAGSGGSVGSDHAWGNHALIMGAAVRGGDFYGTFPTLALNGPDDTDSGSSARGRWIPTTSIDQYSGTLATWYGLPANQLATVFPYLSRFSASNLGFLM